MVLVALFLAVPRGAAPADVPAWIWLMPLKVAMQIFGCDGSLCGRIGWLPHPRDQAGHLVRDKENPDPALQ